ncbi:uncharacterized protein PITG_06837 [Phytophthora infestans T30-4]|uniref:Uncharacterized protein n=1 Tax=Phytophthora infestans (strain T30-4) TaxID=403677 RepID=D0N6K4_PHYIT|nr:uncharacterized protein PITG_06837 [Phytophthora infestans T30-4]EEY53203.1 hypothetical protein PITG_06837 [Phytophthora infestans T30-4]|eukprot:XP_002904821.1 hypothetical protein PITG_06837 [Phytophthora infestans T30-4]
MSSPTSSDGGFSSSSSSATSTASSDGDTPSAPKAPSPIVQATLRNMLPQGWIRYENKKTLDTGSVSLNEKKKKRQKKDLLRGAKTAVMKAIAAKDTADAL